MTHTHSYIYTSNCVYHVSLVCQYLRVKVEMFVTIVDIAFICLLICLYVVGYRNVYSRYNVRQHTKGLQPKFKGSAWSISDKMQNVYLCVCVCE